MEFRKRIRKDSGKRWTKEDKNVLLSIIAESLENFERPTAQVYYDHIIQQNSQFEEYGWKAMRDKVRNLKACYNKALDWLKNSCNEVTEDAESNTRAYLLKLCEDFDLLQYIFSNKNNANALFIHDSADVSSSPATTTESTLTGEPVAVAQPEDEPSHVQLNPLDDIRFFTETAPSNSITRVRPRLQSSNSNAYLAQVQRDKIAFRRERLEFLKATEERKRKLDEEQLALESQKIDLDREKMIQEFRLREMEILNNFELNKMRLEREMALKELELQYKYNKQ
ncbi:uncharacterized protein [Halyomorpha halys]|uniref:uncharacterized protein n=1 Tax=Halyomorpha halys TaxID=286706 RepID=UPI0006D5041E|nr:uncharacterized protein LOC106680314 [Halyomorpha halys]